MWMPFVSSVSDVVTCTDCGRLMVATCPGVTLNGWFKPRLPTETVPLVATSEEMNKLICRHGFVLVDNTAAPINISQKSVPLLLRVHCSEPE